MDSDKMWETDKLEAINAKADNKSFRYKVY